MRPSIKYLYEKLRSSDPVNRKKIPSTFFFSLLVCRNIDQPKWTLYNIFYIPITYKNSKSIAWPIAILIFISSKRAKAGKRFLKTNINDGKYGNIGNKNKTVIHIP